jgi:hypothetical protein
MRKDDFDSVLRKLLLIWLSAGSLVWFAGLHAAETKAAPPPAPRIDIAHSALLIADATVSDNTLFLRLRNAKTQAVIQTNDLTFNVDGKPQASKAQMDGTYAIALDALKGTGERNVEIIVGHDGIREILANKIAAIDAKSTGLSLGGHNQLAWWILNIGVVLIGALALSRKKSF